MSDQSPGPTPEQRAAVDRLTVDQLAKLHVASEQASSDKLRTILHLMIGISASRSLVRVALDRARAYPDRAAFARAVDSVRSESEGPDYVPVPRLADSAFLLATDPLSAERRIIRTAGERFTVAVLPPGSTAPAGRVSHTCADGSILTDVRPIDPLDPTLLPRLLASAAQWLEQSSGARMRP